MGYKKALPITKRSAFKQVPEGAKVTGSSSDSYLKESPTGQIIDTTVLTTDYVTPGSGWKSTGVTDVQAYEKADKNKYPTFDAFQAAAEAYRSDFKSNDVPGSTKDTTEKPLTIDEPGQPKKTGDAFYAPEKRKQYRTAKITRNQREKQAKKDLRKGLIDQSTYDERLKQAMTDYDTNISSIESSTKKQLEQSVNPRTGRSVTMQEQKDPFSRPATKKDLSADQLSKLKTENKNSKTKAGSGGTSLETSFLTGAADVVSNIMKKRDDKAVEDFNKATSSLFMKSSFKMPGYGKKNKK